MYIYIYICTVYTVIWEYGNYTGPNSIFAEREREREKERVRTLLSAFAVCLHINMRYDGDMQCMFVLLC